MRDTLVVMGVSGSGKTTLGRKLAQALARTFSDADDFHPAANIEKMRRGIGLTDADRKPWLDALIAHLNAERREPVVLACSALTRALRRRLRDEVQQSLRFIYLDVARAELERRLRERRDHYAKVTLLDSQLATLEVPRSALIVDANGTIDETCARILALLAVTQPV